jgi:V/A-type H+-transporting ATPase subunit C
MRVSMLKYINETTNTQEEYGYACARIRELEKHLLNKEIINKMIGAPDLENALKVLIENNLSEYSFENTDSHYIDKVLTNTLKVTLNIINEISPYPYFLHLFRWKYDFHNLKVLLKAKALNKKEPYPIYNGMGNISSNGLFAAVFEGKYQLVPVKIERIIKQSEAEYIKSENLQLMEIILDQGYYEIIFDQLEEINNPFLFYLYKTEIDLINLSIACRCKIRGIRKSKLSEILVKYGYFPIQKIIDIYDNSLHTWSNDFQKTEYSTIVEEGIKYWLENNSLLKLEQLSDNYLLSLLKIGKYTTFGLESIIAYYYAKENDIKNIRMIINGKRYSLPNDSIKKYVRDAYV